MVTAVQASALSNDKPQAPLAKVEGIADVQSRFLELLVAQLKNQDPLSPMDNAQVTSQMAQLSTVSGIENLNKTMEGLGQVIAAGQFSQAVALVNKQVLIRGDEMLFSDAPVGGQFDATRNFDKVKVVISDSAGNPVREINLGRQARGLQEFKWDGVRADGVKSPSGRYTFEVTGIAGGEAQPLQTFAFDRILSVDNQGVNGFSITMASGASRQLNDIVKVF